MITTGTKHEPSPTLPGILVLDPSSASPSTKSPSALSKQQPNDCQIRRRKWLLQTGLWALQFLLAWPWWPK